MDDLIKRFGQTDTEVLAEEKIVCRQIVKEIWNFGVNQRQALFIIYLMAMELDDVDKMQTLTSIIRDLGSQDLFLVDRAET